MIKHFKIPFAKFHGLGNDWIVVSGRNLSGPRSSSRALAGLARLITNRHEGVGADGLIVVLSPRSKQHDARARFFNTDGSEAEMSGNGIRCAAAFILAGGAGLRHAPRRRRLRIETVAGVKCLETAKAEPGKWIFRVEMGAPILDPDQIPFNAGDRGSPIVGFQMKTQHGLVPVTVTSIGNPHCTVLVSDFSVDWWGLGKEIERHPLFPRRTNVEFVRAISRREIEARFWERGVGQTASSGTGSCGAVVACILNGLTDRKVRVRTLAGTLEVSWPEGGEVALTGPVERIAEGTYYYGR